MSLKKICVIKEWRLIYQGLEKIRERKREREREKDRRDIDREREKGIMHIKPNLQLSQNHNFCLASDTLILVPDFQIRGLAAVVISENAYLQGEIST